MIDTLMKYRDRASSSGVLDELGLEEGSYVIMTLHRPSNVDVKANFVSILNALSEIHQRVKIVFPMHPRWISAGK